MMKKIISYALSLIMIATVFAGIPTKEVKAATNGIVDVGLGTFHGGAVKENGSLWMWGWNFDGEVGDGTKTSRETPVNIMNDVESVCMSYGTSAAIKKDGSLWMWGDNSFGQLGDGTKTNRSKPWKVMEDVKQVSIGCGFAAALKTDGSLWTWGDNGCGQLGDGTTEERYKPVKVLDNVKEVDLNFSVSAALDEAGNLYVWGLTSSICGTDYDNYYQYYTPAIIMEDVKEFALGESYIAVIDEHNTLWTWGHNGYGQLGDGTTTDSKKPIRIMDNVSDVETGEYHTAVIDEDGSLWMWGGNYYGQVGDGTDIHRSTPVKVLKHVEKVVLGEQCSAAIDEEGSLWMWGDGHIGQLEDADDKAQFKPIKIIDNAFLLAQKISAKNIEKTVSSSANTVSINATRKGDAKLTYKSNNKNITVSSKGKVTIKKNYIGKATITITAAKTNTYKKATKTITVTVKPVKATINSWKYTNKKLVLKNKKNIGDVKYQVQYATNSKFNSAKSKTFAYNKNGYTVLKNPAKGKTYYVRIRGTKKVNGKTYNGAWSAVKKVKVK